MDIFEAIRSDDIKAVFKMLMNDETLVNAKELWNRRHKKTPLHVAIDSGRIQIANLLIMAGADVNAKNFIDETPLHRAVIMRDKGFFKRETETNRKNLIEKMIRFGADVNAKSSEGWTPLYMAIIIDNTEIIELLKQHGAAY